jgi:EAL domain-containing protein (putative c-di-GMP-specific phosphodiesterase class I)/putative methionine-R-sulfoxide reductase with GAF domain
MDDGAGSAEHADESDASRALSTGSAGDIGTGPSADAPTRAIDTKPGTSEASDGLVRPWPADTSSPSGTAPDPASLVPGSLHELLEPGPLLERAVNGLLTLVPTATGAALAVPDTHGTLVYQAAAGTLAAHVGQRIPIADSLSGLAYRTGTGLRCDDASTDERVDIESCRLLGVESMICHPLVRAGLPIGVLKVASDRPAAFDERHQAACAMVAGTIAALLGVVADLSLSRWPALPGETAHPGSDGSSQPAADPGADDSAADRPGADDSAADRPGADDSAADRPGADDPGTIHSAADHPGAGPGTPEVTAAEQAAVARYVRHLLAPQASTADAERAELRRIIEEGQFHIVVQPIVSLPDERVVAVEALSRFTIDPPAPPDQVFARAWSVGLGPQLECTAARRALALLDRVPGDVQLTVNASPATIGTLDFVDLLLGDRPERVAVEITEHVRVEDYPRLRRHLDQLRRRGVRLSIDDTGAGFASLHHIVQLAPDYIKLDRQLVAGIDIDPVRQALGAALVHFAHHSGATVIAEGVETAAELASIEQLGFDLVQGFHLARPTTVDELYPTAQPTPDPPGRARPYRRRSVRPSTPVTTRTHGRRSG